MVASLLALVLSACGGGGGSGSTGGTSGGGASTPPSGSRGTPTPIRTATAARPADTPTPLPTPTGMSIHPGSSILDALRAAPIGSTVVVAPGTYPALAIRAGDLQGPVTLFGDVTGRSSDSGGGAVIIEGNGAAALDIEGVSGLTIDGFTLEGGNEEGLLILDSVQTTVRNCVVTRNAGDGIFVDRSNEITIFNNLVSGQRGGGIRVYGSNTSRVLNNTVYGHRDNGIVIGDSQETMDDAQVENNIVNGNSPVGIVVDPGVTNYRGDFNLDTDGYGSATSPGASDITDPPLFADPTNFDFYLTPTSAAINAGDPTLDVDLVAQLSARSTQTDGTLDAPPVDLGYHYAPPPPTPTPPPRNTRPKKTATPTPTP